MLVKAMREGLGRAIVFIDYITRSAPVKRSDEAQRQAEQQAASLSVYQFYACPFCVRTRRAIHHLNIPVELRDAQHNQAHRNDLLSGGGKIKVPCLRIEENGKTRWMYESADIIDYLNRRFENIEASANQPET